MIMQVLTATHLRKTYPDHRKQVVAVADVSLQLAAGEVLAFLGPNGAGKTTTVKMIAGLIVPDTGTVEVMGRNPHRQPQALRQIGAVLEGNRNLYWRLTPSENLEYFGVLRGLTRQVARQRGQVLLERFGLAHKARTPTQGLSRGMQQKLAIAVALIHEPQLLLLDEPTLGLDVEATETVKQLVQEIAQTEGRSILLTTHQLDVAEQLSDRVAIIRQGQIVAEAATSNLIQQFSSGTYVIEVAQNIDQERLQKLATLGIPTQAIQQPDQTSQTMLIRLPEPDLLYPVLEILNPLPLLKVEQEQASLTDIFLRLVGEAE
jgi:ABC-2 type transport system ATP-binding protein